MKQTLFLLALLPSTLSISHHTTCFKNTPKVDPLQIHCLATTIYGEGRGESTMGQVAIAFTVVNRAVNKSLCQVALAKKQYSIFNGKSHLRTVANNLKLEPKYANHIDRISWAKANAIAKMVLMKSVKDPTYNSTHYVAYKSLKHIPKWTHELKITVKIENHTFFKSKKSVDSLSA